uniref:DH domain-containing protein n=1 Tax=Strigamia maritima TaxID=126957 RepID=T1JEI5_STRMM
MEAPRPGVMQGRKSPIPVLVLELEDDDEFYDLGRPFHSRPRARSACPKIVRNVSEDFVLEGEDHSGGVFGKLSSFDDDEFADREDDTEQEGPSAAALSARRRALVPPKLLSDGYDSATEEVEGAASQAPPAGNSSDSGSTRSVRRSSIVVIPPMQICPGDLLVYSKVLTQRNNLLGSSLFSELDGSTTSLAVSDDTSRKGKNAFSFLRLFDRSNRSKSDPMCGLEEVLNSITPSEFSDDQLSKYKGMQWYDFVTTFEDRASCYEVRIPSPELLSPVHKSSHPGSSNDKQPASISTLISALPCTANSTTPPGSPSRDQFCSMMPRNEQKRKEAVWDLFQSECMFLYDHLMVLKNVFMEPLKKVQVEGYGMFAEPEVLFGNLDELCNVTYAFCKEFINLLLQDMGTTGDLQVTEVLVKLFQKSSKAMSVSAAFHRYSLNYINALNYLETLRRHLEFIEFEKWCQRDSRCKKLQLTDLLVAPVQHIMKIPIILKDIEMRTDNPHDKEVIAQILETEENSLRELDDKMKWLKNFERLLEIQKNITWPSVMELHPKVFIPDKSSITENWPSSCSRGSTFSLDGGSMRYIVYKQPLSLDRFFIHDVGLHDAAINKLDCAFVLVCLNRFQQIVNVYTLQASNDQTKQTWLTKLKRTQEKWKQMLQSTFRNQQHMGNSSSGVK